MRSQQRQFIHCIAEAYNLDSESQDPEPHRSVVLHRTSRTALPERNLSQAHAIWTKKQQSSGAPKLGSMNSSMPLQMRRTPKQAYNAILLENVQFGLTRVELERSIDNMMARNAVSDLRFTASWITDEDVILIQRNGSELGLQVGQIEHELLVIKPSLKRFITAEQRLAKVVELCWLTRDNVIAYRESSDESKSSSGAWSTVTTPSSSNANLKAKFASYNVFAALGATAPKSTAESSAVAKKAKKEPQPVATSWEELDEDENKNEAPAENTSIEQSVDTSLSVAELASTMDALTENEFQDTTEESVREVAAGDVSESSSATEDVSASTVDIHETIE